MPSASLDRGRARQLFDPEALPTANTAATMASHVVPPSSVQIPLILIMVGYTAGGLLLLFST
jgi:hypothetical protein